MPEAGRLLLLFENYATLDQFIGLWHGYDRYQRSSFEAFTLRFR
jgi:hypothetical protein